MRRSFTLLLSMLALAGAARARQEATSERPIRVAGTRVSLVPPPDFVPSERFTGFAREGDGASIVVLEMPVPAAEATPALADSAALSKRGMVLLGKEQAVSDGGHDGLLFHYRQAAAGLQYRKWMFVAGDAKRVLMVTASFPEEAGEALSAALKRSVLSTRWHRGEGVAAAEGLSYSISEGGPLKLASRVSNNLLFTPGGTVPVKSVEEPYFVAGPSTFPVEIRDRKAFSASRLLRIDGVTDIGAAEPKVITVDGLEGYEIVTAGKDVKSGEPVTVYQVTLFEGSMYYLMQGIVGARNALAHVETFKRMARSFRRVQ